MSERIMPAQRSPAEQKAAPRTAGKPRAGSQIAERYKLKQKSLSDDVADHVAVLLATNELQPGQRVYERELAELLGISRVPVREAMRVLHAQGVVRIEPNRGAYLASFGPSEMEDMLELRVAIERAAVRHVLNNPSIVPKLVASLRESVEDMRRSVLVEDRLAHCQADLSFHHKIIRASDSPLLEPIWDTLSRVILIFLMREQREWNAKPEVGLREHQGLITLIEKGSAEMLHARLESHITSNYRQQKSGKTRRRA